MPRPLKNVSPDTLGGRIRAARQTLHLSLSEVAGQEYSTSLISQIERNKIEPSAGSLKYLAERLHLPLNELTVLAQQHRETEVYVIELPDNDTRERVIATPQAMKASGVRMATTHGSAGTPGCGFARTWPV